MESLESREVRIEKARPEDAAALQEVFYRAWLATYPNEGQGITTEDIEARFKDRLSPEVLARRTERLAHPPEGELSLVARAGDQVVGICRVVVHEDHNEQSAFYLLPEYQRRGLGTKLWKEARKHIDPTKPTIVHVATYNTTAIRFYESLGYKDTGKRFADERFKFESGAHIPEMEMMLNPEK